MLTVVQRPDAYLYQNNPPEYGEDPYYYSRWSAAHLPLVYKISTDKSPVNTFDEMDNYTGVFSTNGYATFDLSGTYQNYIIGSKVKVTGNVYDGIYEVKNVVAGEYIVLDVLFLETDTGTLVSYFENYQILIKLYAGIATGHPLQSTDPMTYIGTFAIAPNPSNIAIIDVSDLVKQKINQDNDINGTGRPNDLNSWTSFYIEYAETYDLYAGSIPYTYTSAYTVDTLENCTSINIVNGSFISNIDGWLQTSNPFGYENATWAYDSGSAKVTQPNIDTYQGFNQFYQQLNLKKSIEYKIRVNIEANINTLDKNWAFIIYASNNLTPTNSDRIYIYTSDSNTYSDITTIVFTLNEDKKYLIFTGTFPQTSAIGYFKINSVESVGSANCKAYIYAHNGTRQFYDLIKNQRTIYGGNMAEYVMNYNEQQILGKFLTRFETPLLFPGNYFDISCIIPQSTIDIPYTEDGLLYRINRYDENATLIDKIDTEIENNGDGVYRLRVDDKIGNASSLKLQLVRHQTNVDWFGVYYKTGINKVQIGNYNDYSDITLDVGYLVLAVDVFANNKAIVTGHNGVNTKVYYINNGALSTLTTNSGITGYYIKAFDENNWIVVNSGSSSKALVCKNGAITLETTTISTWFYGIDGVSIDEIYGLSKVIFSNPKIVKRNSLGVWSAIIDFGTNAISISGRPSFMLNERRCYVSFVQSGTLKIGSIDIDTFNASYENVASETTSNSVDYLDSNNAICTSETKVYLFGNSAWALDTGFDVIRASVSDTTNIVSCKYVGEENIIVSTTERLYTKIGSIWSEGVGGTYISGATFGAVDGYYNSETVELLVSENKTIEIESECSRQSIYLSWISSLGNWEHFLFTARKTYDKTVDNVTSTRRNIFASFPDNFTSETEQDKIRIEAYDKVTVRSQFVTRERLDVIAEIITSIRVQAWYSSEEKITVIVDTKKVTKYSDGDKLYAIEFDIIYPMNQTISQ